MDASNCPQLHPAAFGRLWRHRAHSRMPPLPLGEAAGQRLPVIDVLWVITADNEIFNHHLYYRGSAEPGRKPLLFGQGCADGFGAGFGAGRAGWSLCGGRWIEVVVVEPLCVSELSLAGAGHRWGSPCRAGRAQTQLGDMGSLCPCPHCHQQCRAGSVWHPGICLEPLWRAGGGLWVGFSHSFVSLPVLWLRQGAGGSSHGGYCSGLRGHWDVHPQSGSTFLASGAKGISPAPSFSWKQGAFPGGSARLPRHAAFSHRY